MPATGFQASPGWYWPDDVPKAQDSNSNTTCNSPPTTPKPEPSNSEGSSNNSHSQQSSQSRRKYWPPRQCRICLEVVQPTYHTPSESLPGVLRGTPRVTYESEEGRLLRPCNCRGTSKYVHEGCLQAWRHADPSYGRRNYWQCPTCGFRYRLARLGWGRLVGSAAAQVALTIGILFSVVFFLGFVADPIINMYLDPWSYLMPFANRPDVYYDDDHEPYTWTEHFLKGFAAMGVTGFLKVIFASPWNFFRFGGTRRGRTTGRDRYEQVSWLIILIGVFTFLVAIFKGVRAWSRKTLEKVGEKVMDVQGDDDDDIEEEQASSSAS
ncbi:hypothetical protein GQ43DRAFT_450458 [Delitschia confertaspora ATCC 74209]|uniref:RING-CH-type domain-containing protein n=1 Tax=Delitschia confertaspora ATCC 74209 TaxID=1513339 RepID=A0A9P4JH84_9PLEO|nr:hypothetical protein GQ43DRAFT_450458 [Delitschia confertaspora ATCC 74209]